METSHKLSIDTNIPSPLSTHWNSLLASPNSHPIDGAVSTSFRGSLCCYTRLRNELLVVAEKIHDGLFEFGRQTELGVLAWLLTGKGSYAWHVAVDRERRLV